MENFTDNDQINHNYLKTDFEVPAPGVVVEPHSPQFGGCYSWSLSSLFLNPLGISNSACTKFHDSLQCETSEYSHDFTKNYTPC